MALEITPPLEAGQESALPAALEQAGVALDPVPRAYRSPWLRTAAREAVDDEPELAAYARSPRSTRGATSA